MKDIIKIILYITIVIILFAFHTFFLFSDKYLDEIRSIPEIILIIYSFYFMNLFFFKIFFKKPEKINNIFKIGILIFLYYFSITGIGLTKDILNAIELKKIKETMANMRHMANFVEEYYEKNGTYPFPYYKGSAKILLNHFKNIKYLDGWKNEIFYFSFDNGESYLFQSAGKDEKFEKTYLGLEKVKYKIPNKGYFIFSKFYIINRGPFTNSKKDTIFFNGRFSNWYEGFCNPPPSNNEYEFYIKKYLNILPNN